MNRARRSLFLVFSLALLLAGCSDPGSGPATPRASLQGVITDVSGAPVASAAVTLNPVGGQGASGALRTTSDQAGAYSFITTDAGAYNLLVTTGDGRGSFKANIAIAGTATVTVNIQVTELGAINGVAILEGHPADSAGIDVYVPGTSFLAKTADDGSFHLSGVPAGTYDVYADAPGHKRATVTGVTVATGATTNLPATITLAPENYAPEAAFTTQIVRATLTVDASDSVDPDGSIVNYAWDFGNGATATGVTAQHTYATVGTKAVTLTVTDNGGRTDSLTKQVEIETVVTRLAATTDPNRPLTTVTIAPGGTVQLEIDVSSAVAAAGAALYVELSNDLPMDVTWQGETYYSASSEYFSLNPIPPTASTILKPSALGLLIACRGSCVIVESRTSAALVSITNPSAASVSVNLFAFTEDFQDVDEPDNNTLSGAPLLGFTNAGALELIGDVDYYQVNVAGTFVFDAFGPIEMVAHVYGAAGQLLFGPFSPDSQLHVEAGEYIRVAAVSQTAAASANSVYYLSYLAPE